MGIRIVVGEGEPISVALRRLKKKVEQNNIPWEIRQRVHFIDGTDARRAKEYQRWYRAHRAMIARRNAPVS